MKDKTKNNLAIGAFALGITGSIIGMGSLLEKSSKVYFEDIKKSSIVVTDDNDGVRYHLAQKKIDDSFNYKYFDILNNKEILNSNIVYVAEATKYLSNLYDKESYYDKEDLSNMIDNMCKHQDYVTSNDKIKMKVR